MPYKGYRFIFKNKNPVINLLIQIQIQVHNNYPRNVCTPNINMKYIEKDTIEGKIELKYFPNTSHIMEK